MPKINFLGNSEVCTTVVNIFLTMAWTIRGYIPGKVKRFSLLENFHPVCYSNAKGACFFGDKAARA
jgi:hypothetical protein